MEIEKFRVNCIEEFRVNCLEARKSKKEKEAEWERINAKQGEFCYPAPKRSFPLFWIKKCPNCRATVKERYAGASHGHRIYYKCTCGYEYADLEGV